MQSKRNDSSAKSTCFLPSTLTTRNCNTFLSMITPCGNGRERDRACRIIDWKPNGGVKQAHAARRNVDKGLSGTYMQ